MDLSPLGLKMMVQCTGSGRHEIEWISIDSDRLLLAPLFTANEGDRGEASPRFPPELGLEHLSRALTLPFVVEKSDLAGLHVRLRELSPGDPERWEQILQHLRDHLGRKARGHPRIMIPEFQLGVWLSGDQEGKGKVFDISVGGMRVVSNAEVSIGQVLTFQIDVPNTLDWAEFLRGVSWQGIVRSVEMRGFSLEFNEGQPFRKVIQKLIDELMQRRMQRLTYPRFAVYDFGFSATLEDPQTGKVDDVRIKDVSVTSSYVLTALVLPVDQKVILTIQESEAFSSLKERLPIEAQVIRNAPDGVILSFHDSSEGAKNRLTAWTTEFASKLRVQISSTDKSPKPKATLSVSYGSDLLFIREYLYNISAGGLFFPGGPHVEKGDVIKFVLDLSGTQLAKKFPDPPAFLGKVVRTTDQGIGVQFLDPEQIRIQLESILSEHAQHSKTRDREPRPIPRFTNRPAALTLAGVIALLTTAAVYLYRRTLPEVTPYLIEAPAPSTSEIAPTDAPASADESNPGILIVEYKHMLVSVTIADIVDVTYDPKTGGEVTLTSGLKLPAAGFVPYLPPELGEKYQRLREGRE